MVKNKIVMLAFIFKNRRGEKNVKYNQKFVSTFSSGSGNYFSFIELEIHLFLASFYQGKENI